MSVTLEYEVIFGHKPDDIKIKTIAYHASDAIIQAAVAYQAEYGDLVEIPMVTCVKPARIQDAVDMISNLLKINPKGKR